MADYLVEPTQLVDLYVYGFSLPEVSELTGVARSTVRHHVLRAGALRPRTEAVQKAGSEGRLGSGLRGKKRCFSESHKANIRRSAIERGERTAKGVSLKPNGYLEFTRGPNKFRSVHRVEAERKIGRKLRRNEHVHHCDEVKTNNDPSNLEVLPIGEHMSLHGHKNHMNRERNPDGTWR